MWGQGDEEKSLLSSSGGSLDYGGASVVPVSVEKRIWIVDL